MESAHRDGTATILCAESEPTDEQLVDRFRCDGDREALSELIRRYAPRLRRLLYSLLGPDYDAVSDAEQEVYVSLISRVGSTVPSASSTIRSVQGSFAPRSIGSHRRINSSST